MDLIFKFNISELEYDYIDAYKNSENFNERVRYNKMLLKKENLSNMIDNFIIECVGTTAMKHLKKYVYSDMKIVEGFKKNECKKILKNKSKIIHRYIIDIECSN